MKAIILLLIMAFAIVSPRVLAIDYYNDGTPCQVSYTVHYNDAFEQTIGPLNPGTSTSIGKAGGGRLVVWIHGYNGATLVYSHDGDVSNSFAVHNTSGSAGCSALPAPTTNSWCVYNIDWVNHSLKGAYVGGLYTYSGGTMVDAVLTAWVAPGAHFIHSITNDIGTNTYTCPTLTIYNTREGEPADEEEFGGTRYEQTTGAGPGSGSGTPTTTPGPIMSNQPTNNYTAPYYTNAPTRKDIYDMSDLIAAALSELEQTVQGADAAARSNAASLNQSLSTVNTNLGSKLDSLANSFGTNFSMLNSNLSGLATNMTALSSNIARLDWVSSTNKEWWSNNAAAIFAQMGSGTNAAAASNAAASILGSQFYGDYGTAEGYANSLSNAASGFAPEELAEGGMSFEFCGHTLNFDPEYWYPGIMAIIYAAWSFVLVLGFSFWSGRLVLQVSHTYSTMATGGVPNLEGNVFGTGGNFAGVAVAIVVPVVIIGTLVVMSNWVISQLMSMLGLLPDAVSGFGLGNNNIAMYLFTNTFPVPLFLSLCATRIGLKFALAKAMFIRSAMLRFMWGK